MISERKKTLSFIEQLINQSKNLQPENKRKILAITRELFSNRLGLNFERMKGKELDIWQQHLEKGKFVFLKEYKKFPHFFNQQAKTFGTLIRGDNLPILVALQNIYINKVDFIYIDPPYNNSGGYIYNDDYRIKGNKEGITVVNEQDVFRHARWLTMMEVRLKEAKKLMKDSGFIAVSIDDNEFFYLKLLMDQIFGENCYKGTIIWKKGGFMNSKKDATIPNEYEQILVYAKSKKSKFNTFLRNNNQKKQTKSLMQGGYAGLPEDRPNLCYSVKCPHCHRKWEAEDKNGNKKRWIISKENWITKEKLNLITWNCGNGKKRCQPYRKEYVENKDSIRAIIDKELLSQINSSNGGKDLKNDFNQNFWLFEYPKPVNLIKYLIKFMSPSDGLILDFFAGSGTTGCAVAKLNQEDNGNRKFVLINNNEGDDKKKLDANSKYCVFDDVLYPRLKNNKKKYEISCKVFELNEKEMEKQKFRSIFALYQKQLIVTGFSLVSIKYTELQLPTTENIFKEMFIKAKGKKYGYFLPNLDFDLQNWNLCWDKKGLWNLN